MMKMPPMIGIFTIVIFLTLLGAGLSFATIYVENKNQPKPTAFSLPKFAPKNLTDKEPPSADFANASKTAKRIYRGILSLDLDNLRWELEERNEYFDSDNSLWDPFWNNLEIDIREYHESICKATEIINDLELFSLAPAEHSLNEMTAAFCLNLWRICLLVEKGDHYTSLKVLKKAKEIQKENKVYLDRVLDLSRTAVEAKEKMDSKNQNRTFEHLKEKDESLRRGADSSAGVELSLYTEAIKKAIRETSDSISGKVRLSKD